LEVTGIRFLEKILDASPVVLYGEKGVGKTSFLVALARFLGGRRNGRVFLILRESLGDFDFKDVAIIHVPENAGIDFYLQCIRDIIKEAMGSSNGMRTCHGGRLSILIDDVLPRELLLAKISDLRVASLLRGVLFLGKILSDVAGAVFIVSTIENIRRAYPFKAKYFLRYGFNLLRLERISRVRRLCLMRLARRGGRLVYLDKTCVKAMQVGGRFVFFE